MEKDKYLDTAKELKKYLITDKYARWDVEEAFVRWYIDATYGDFHQEERRIFSKKEGGIDAVVDRGTDIYIYQMKYEVAPRLSTILRNDLLGFSKIFDYFNDKEKEDEFKSWLKTIKNDSAREYFQDLYKLIDKQKKTPHFIFVTTKRSGYSLANLTIEDANIVLPKWELFAEGFCPVVDSIELNLEKVFCIPSTEGFNTYVGLADTTDFLNLMENDKNERLFAQNVRTDLKSFINKQVRDTYKKEKETFWLGNNGIYIICKKVTPSGIRYSLKYPSVINGSQTLHSIKAANIKHPCPILVRILEMDILSNHTLMGSIIRRTNTQNPMKLVNLAAHDSCQLNVARYLAKYKIFYVRREHEWKNEKRDILYEFIPLKMMDLIKWLSTTHNSIGLGLARTSPSELFDDANYRMVFGAFDPSFKSFEYNKLPMVVWSGLFYSQLLKDLGSGIYPYAKIASLLFIKIIYEVILSSKELTQIALKKLEAHEYGKKRIPRIFLSYINENITILKNMQKKAQNNNPDKNIDFSNFFKNNKLVNQAYISLQKNNKLEKLIKICSNNIINIK